jgi:hypothetical protein
MGNICIKQKLKRKIYPINLSYDNTLKLTSLKNNFFNIEDNFPDKHDIENYRKLYLQNYYSHTTQNEICIRPSTAHSRNKFNINS